MNEPSVPCLFGPPRQKSYKMAVADCLRALKRELGLSVAEIAETLGCSDQTIRNALDDEGNDCLNPVTMLRIGYEFGEERIGPILALAKRACIEPATLSDDFRKLKDGLASLERKIEERAA